MKKYDAEVREGEEEPRVVEFDYFRSLIVRVPR
jgi:hypothetical protein